MGNICSDLLTKVSSLWLRTWSELPVLLFDELGAMTSPIISQKSGASSLKCEISSNSMPFEAYIVQVCWSWCYICGCKGWCKSVVNNGEIQKQCNALKPQVHCNDINLETISGKWCQMFQVLRWNKPEEIAQTNTSSAFVILNKWSRNNLTITFGNQNVQP